MIHFRLIKAKSSLHLGVYQQAAIDFINKSVIFSLYMIDYEMATFILCNLRINDLDHGVAKEPINSFPEWIHRFL